MNVYLRAARDAVATVGAAYIPFSLVRVIAHPEFDIYFVGPVEELLGVIGVALFALLAVGYSFAENRKEGRGRFAGSVANSGSEKGNVLFLILIAVALFAALSYAVTSSNRGSGSIDKEQAKLNQAVMDSYMAAINTGTLRLRMAGCSTIDYTEPANQAPTGDKSCFLFHPDGGGVSFQDLGLDSCALQGIDITALAIGGRCGNIVYAGTSSGNRLYTTAADQGQFTWNNGSANWTVTGATSTSDGLANTNTLVALADAGAPYNAANACRALGADWYLPSRDELNVLYTNRAAIGGFNLSGSSPAGLYWSSSEGGSNSARGQQFSDGFQTYSSKSIGFSVRCVRR